MSISSKIFRSVSFWYSKVISAAMLFGVLSYSSVAGAAACENDANYHGGYFFTHWSAVKRQVCIDLLPGGQYSYNWWGGANSFVGGKGWGQGSTNRVVGYNAGYYNAFGNSVLSLYGWSTNPLVEYYVVDSWTGWRPPAGPNVRSHHGTVQSDGGTYDLFIEQRYGPNILGYGSFTQYWSVRQTPRPQGQNNYITFANHVNAWRSKGWNLGNMNYQVMGTEGYRSQGGVNVTVWGW